MYVLSTTCNSVDQFNQEYEGTLNFKPDFRRLKRKTSSNDELTT